MLMSTDGHFTPAERHAQVCLLPLTLLPAGCPPAPDYQRRPSICRLFAAARMLSPKASRAYRPAPDAWQALGREHARREYYGSRDSYSLTGQHASSRYRRLAQSSLRRRSRDEISAPPGASPRADSHFAEAHELGRSSHFPIDLPRRSPRCDRGLRSIARSRGALSSQRSYQKSGPSPWLILMPRL